MTDSDLEAINVKLDRVLELLQSGQGHQLIPTYTGSRKLDYMLEEAYTNNAVSYTHLTLPTICSV